MEPNLNKEKKIFTVKNQEEKSVTCATSALRDNPKLSRDVLNQS
jgi:hypothetical protein